MTSAFSSRVGKDAEEFDNGMSKPKAPYDTLQGRTLNRRVELVRSDR